jgi:hypothetical protein
MNTVMRQPTIYVCRKCKRHECVNDALRGAGGDVVPVRCQKICSGPVAGVKIGGHIEWYDRLDTGKRLAGLRKLAKGTATKPVKALAKRRVGKRADRLRV